MLGAWQPSDSLLLQPPRAGHDGQSAGGGGLTIRRHADKGGAQGQRLLSEAALHAVDEGNADEEDAEEEEESVSPILSSFLLCSRWRMQERGQVGSLCRSALTSPPS